MRLLLPSLFAWCYVVVSGLYPLPWRWPYKVFAAFIVLLISLKYVLYVAVGGSFFSPALPRMVQLGLEALYGALIVLVVLLLCKDVLKGVCWLGCRCGLSWHLPFSTATRNLGLMALSVCLGVWGTWEAVRVPDVRTVELAVPRLPAALDGTTIVQLTDLHVGPLLQQHWLRGVVERTNALNPDIIVLTGDMVDVPPSHAGKLTQLGELRAKYGVFGVTGNHEYYVGARGWERAFRKLGIDMLRNEHRLLDLPGGQLVVAGLPDYMDEQAPDIRMALKGAPEKVVRILLTHRPRRSAARQSVDIQLSGHTHGGQMFFLYPLLAYFNEGFVRGMYHVGAVQLYVSSGTGLWGGFSCRIGVPSEITRIVLRASAS